VPELKNTRAFAHMRTSLAAAHARKCGGPSDDNGLGLLIYCSNYKRSHLVTTSGDCWPDDVRLTRFSFQPGVVIGADKTGQFNAIKFAPNILQPMANVTT